MARAKVVSRAIPQTREEATELLEQIGALQHKIGLMVAKSEERVAAIQAEYAGLVKPNQERLDGMVANLAAWAEANRNELTNGGKTKTVKLPSGEIRWRLTPPKVNLRKVKDIIAELKERGLERFVRIKEEVNKQAMLAEREVAAEVPGVSITQREELVVVPLDLEEIIAGSQKLAA